MTSGPPGPPPQGRPTAAPRTDRAALRRRAARVVEIALCLGLLLAGAWIRGRVARDWTYAGADSFAYLGAASELAERHRYAFRLPLWYEGHAEEPPLGYCRMPGYPLFLAATTEPPKASYVPTLEQAKRAQRAVDLVTCLLVFLLARRVGGRRAAFPALLFSVLSPPLALFSASLLAETLATCLTTLTLLLILLAVPRGPGPPRRGPWIAAGAAAALTTLTRVDGLCLLPCLAVPLVGARWPEARRGLGLALLAFLLAFSPWPLRNLARFGDPHPLAGQCDIAGRAMRHTGFFVWFATWLEREDQTPQTLYCFFRDTCAPTVASYPAEAFDSPEERREVARLFLLHAREGLSAQVDAGLRALALRKIARHPLRSLLTRPARRAYHLWTSAIDQPLRSTITEPWPRVTAKVRPHLRRLSRLVLALGLLGIAILLARRDRASRAGRALGLLALCALCGRTGLIALIGFVDARYVLELHPLLYALCGVALGAALPQRRAGSTISQSAMDSMGSLPHAQGR